MVSWFLNILGFLGCFALALYIEQYWNTCAVALGIARLIWLLMGACVVGWVWRVSKIIRLVEEVREELRQIRWQTESQKKDSQGGAPPDK